MKQYSTPVKAMAGKIALLTLTAATVVLGGCSSTTIRTTEVVPVIQQQEEIAEELLLDVGVAVFDPGFKEALENVDENYLVFEEVRNAEARYFPQLLVDTLQTSAAWGAVRVVPSESAFVDVLVQGKILHSDGESLRMQVTATDVGGTQWFSKEYSDLASKYAYDPKRKTDNDAFQNIYKPNRQ